MKSTTNALASIGTQLTASCVVVLVVVLVSADVDAVPRVATQSQDFTAFSTQRFELIYESPELDFDRPWEATLMLLGGVEVSASFGSASISSGAHDENGEQVDIASGSASIADWGIGLYWAPASTGFFLRPTLGYLSQEIGIGDFRQDVPTVKIAGTTEIAGRCSLLASGSALDCDAPNVYRLDIGSLQTGATGGYGLVAGNDTVHLITHVAAGVNVAEVRWMTARIADYSSEQTDFAFVRSLGAEASVGVHLPKLHWSVRLATTFRHFFQFEYGEPLTFHGPVSYDATRQIYVRKLVEVEDASFGSWNVQIATAFVF